MIQRTSGVSGHLRTSGVRAPLVNSSARLMINAGLTPFVAPFEQRSAAGGTAGLSSSAHLRQTFRDSQPRPPLPHVCHWLCQCGGRVGAASSRWRTWGIVHGGEDVPWAEPEQGHWPSQWHASTVPRRRCQAGAWVRDRRQSCLLWEIRGSRRERERGCAEARRAPGETGGARVGTKGYGSCQGPGRNDGEMVPETNGTAAGGGRAGHFPPPA